MNDWEDFAMKATPKKKTAAKAKRECKDVPLNLRVKKSTMAAFKRNAKAFADGNLSEWLRIAGTAHRPAKKA